MSKQRISIKENLAELYTVEFGDFLEAFGLAFGQMAHFRDVAFLQSTNKGPERHLKAFHKGGKYI